MEGGGVRERRGEGRKENDKNDQKIIIIIKKNIYIYIYKEKKTYLAQAYYPSKHPTKTEVVSCNKLRDINTSTKASILTRGPLGPATKFLAKSTALAGWTFNKDCMRATWERGRGRRLGGGGGGGG